MTQDEFYSSIAQPSRLSASVVDSLEHELSEYPYFEAGWMLMLKGMSDLSVTNYDVSLHKGAICIANRNTLFELIQSKPAVAEVAEKEPEKKAIKATSWSLEDFQYEYSSSSSSDGAYSIDNIANSISETDNCEFSDWLDFMDKQPSLQSTDSKDKASQKQDKRQATRSRSLDLISSFLNNDNAEIITPRAIYSAETSKKSDIQREETQSNADNDDILTETLARIYIKQGQFDKAINIFRKLGLKYPEKSSYFASRINELENK